MAYLEEQTKNVNDQYDSQLNNRLQQIQAAREQAVNDLNKQMKDESLKFHGQKVDLDTQKAIEMMRAKEAMAGMGAYNSGDNITAMSRISNNRARGMDGITGAENQFNRDINYRIGQARTNATNQEQDVRNTIGAERARALQEVRDRAYQMEQQRLAQERALAQQRQAYEAKVAAEQKKAQAAQAEKDDFKKRFEELSIYNNQVAKQMLQNNNKDIINRYGNDFYNDVKKSYTETTRGIGKDKDMDMYGKYF